MIVYKEIDINLIKDKSTFDKIQVQKSIFIELFTEISNHYPQHILTKKHPHAKGTKVSQGTNLENCPYQVLDIIRDFNVKSGFNIRILNWWGHGLYILIHLGRDIATQSHDLIFGRFPGFSINISVDPYDYKMITKSKKSFNNEELKNYTGEISNIILHKEIAYQKTIDKQAQLLLDNIDLILNKDLENFSN